LSLINILFLEAGGFEHNNLGLAVVTQNHITGGENVSKHDERTFGVPKSHLISELVKVVEMGRFKADPQIPDAREFETQLKTFGYKINRDTGNVSYESMTEKVHDDLVVAAALPIWYAETQLHDQYGHRYAEVEFQEDCDPAEQW